MNPSLREQFERLALRLNELDANLADPQVLADINRWRSLSREQAEVAQVVQQFRQYQQRERDLQAGREMLADPEMAEMAAEEITLNPAELRIDTFRASGAGGQHVNKTDSAIRITHLPTGLVAECQDDRSQHRNKAKAMAVLQARLSAKERNERAAKEAATRKGLIGSGDRSDRIRTYNFPQGRFTDHRINLTLYKLDRVMDGELDDVIEALRAARAAEQLAALESGA